MPVMIDDQELPAESMGLATVGQVLSHVGGANRLVVSLMIDGREPDMTSLELLRAQPIAGRTVYIETTEPHQIAGQICGDVEQLLEEAERMRLAAVEHLQAGQTVDAFRKLSVCFNAWNHSQDSVTKLARLLRIDLDRIELDDRSLARWLAQFAVQLADIRLALEAKDFVQLSDILSYEADQTNRRWRASIDAIRATMS